MNKISFSLIFESLESTQYNIPKLPDARTFKKHKPRSRNIKYSSFTLQMIFYLFFLPLFSYLNFKSFESRREPSNSRNSKHSWVLCYSQLYLQKNERLFTKLSQLSQRLQTFTKIRHSTKSVTFAHVTKKSKKIQYSVTTNVRLISDIFLYLLDPLLFSFFFSFFSQNERGSTRDL